MTWAAIVAFVQALPKLLDTFNNVLGRLDAIEQAIIDKRTREVTDGLNALNVKLDKVMDDQQKQQMAHDLAELQQRMVTHK